MWQFIRYLPVKDPANIITLGEGNTPVLELKKNLFLKLEQLNPTGSYKDRFASCALSWMKEKRKTRCLATSSGNSGAALAAYCARARIPCQIYLVETTPEGKALQMLAHGAVLTRVRGFGLSVEVTTRLMKALRREAELNQSALLISAFRYSAAAMEGVKTIAHELVSQLGCVDDIFAPVGGGGLLTAVFRGLSDLSTEGNLEFLPRIHAVQPEGCATVTGPLNRGEPHAAPVHCTSGISGLQVPNVIDGELALEAVRKTGGSGQSVSDDAIYLAQKTLAGEGAYCEPAGAAAYAGYLQAVARGQVSAENRVVCLVTGHGFKDVTSVQRMVLDSQIETCEMEEIFSKRAR